MANKISEIKVLEELIKNQYAVIDGKKIEIGNFWSVLQIYFCMKNLQVSINTLCSVASEFDSRLDSKYRVDNNPISPAMMRKYLHLKSSPSQVSHTVVSKTIAKGIDHASQTASIAKILKKYNSFGKDILKDICDSIDGGKGKLVGTKFSVMGNSGFSQVLKLCLVLTELYKNGIIGELSDVNPSEHKSHIIKTIMENGNSVRQIEAIGFPASAL